MGALRKRNDETARERLLETAVKVFALYGYEGASTRMLAKEAAVNISAIMYYFGDKEGLYRASMQHLAAFMKAGVADRAAPIRLLLSQKKTSASEVYAAFKQFLVGMTGFILSDKVSPYAVRIFMREQAEPSPVFDIFYEVMRPVQDTLIACVARLTGMDVKNPALILCTHAILGQITIFRTHREIVLRRMKWKKYDAAAIEKIAAIVLGQTDMILKQYRSRAEAVV